MNVTVNEYECPVCKHRIAVETWLQKRFNYECPSGCGETLMDYRAVVIYEE